MEVLPIIKNEIRYEQVVVLDDTEFIMFLDWNGREGYWYITFSYLDGTTIQGLTGVKVVVNWPLNLLVNDENFPSGTLFAMNETDTDPGLDNLKLMWSSDG